MMKKLLWTIGSSTVHLKSELSLNTKLAVRLTLLNNTMVYVAPASARLDESTSTMPIITGSLENRD
jgi:hypothetical protein